MFLNYSGMLLTGNVTNLGQTSMQGHHIWFKYIKLILPTNIHQLYLNFSVNMLINNVNNIG